LHRQFLKCKIHRATVTEADLNYIGSITIDQKLMETAGIAEYEKIQVLDITNGNRIETYTIKGKSGSGEICINGAAAHLINKGDVVIIVAFCLLDEHDVQSHKPVIVHVDEQNQISNNLSESVLILN